jgi:heme-binding protein
MSFLAPPKRLLTGSGLFAGALTAAALFGGVPVALANEDPAADPPNCSAADLEGVRAGVSAATSTYLFTHPDYNYFMTSLGGLSREDVSVKVKDYLANHPDTNAEITGIRRPLMDIKDRCGAPPSP